MKKLVFILCFFAYSVGTFAQTTKLQIVTPISSGGDVVIQPLGGTGHQGLVFNIPTTIGDDFVGVGSNGTLWMKFLNNKNVWINGKLSAKEIDVSTTFWSDFVFNPDYKLMPLDELENFIKENNHLPSIPTESEVKRDGINVAEMNTKLLQKVEELTLYVIELKKENEQIKKILLKTKQ